MNDGTPAPPPTARDAADDVHAAPRTTDPLDRASRLLTGDRICVDCGYNLIHQPIVREPHYGLWMVRCPECGRAVDVETPTRFERWMPRLGLAAAAIWLVIVVALVPLAALAITGWTMSVAEDYGWHFRSHLFDMQEAERAGEVEGRVSALTQDFPAWFDPDRERILAEAGSPWSHVPATSFLFIPIGWTFLLPMGVALGAFLLGQRRRGLIVTSLVVLVLTALFIGIAWIGINARSQSTSSWQVAAVHATFPIGITIMPAVWLGFAGGMIFARPIVRGLVRVVVPPRLRAPFAFLWIADGKPLPHGIPRAPERLQPV